MPLRIAATATHQPLHSVLANVCNFHLNCYFGPLIGTTSKIIQQHLFADFDREFVMVTKSSIVKQKHRSPSENEYRWKLFWKAWPSETREIIENVKELVLAFQVTLSIGQSNGAEIVATQEGVILFNTSCRRQYRWIPIKL